MRSVWLPQLLGGWGGRIPPRLTPPELGVGSRVLSHDTTLMYEEHPDAYKPIEPLIRSLEHHAPGVRVASLLPLITVKK